MIASSIFAIISALLIAAHFFRIGETGLTLAALMAPGLLALHRTWAIRVFQGLIAAAVFVWVATAAEIINFRLAVSRDWLTAALIMLSVIIFTAVTPFIIERRRIKCGSDKLQSAVPAVSFFLTAFILGVVQVIVEPPLLILERLHPGLGWLEIFLISIYAAFITEKMLDKSAAPRWRRRIWLVFSALFFGQLILGLAGFDIFLMSGKLHLPVPAMIAAGPLYRGEGLFMPILFLLTTILVGPAWCSYICYIGSWDNLAADRRRSPRPLPSWAGPMRMMILVIIVAAAIGFRLAGVPTLAATIAGLIFGLVGVGLMFFRSRRRGAMTHCVAYCPIGLLADWIGKISPFRLRIKNECTECGLCRIACRYDALNKNDIERRRPALSCTLCGDCLKSCRDGFIEYRFPGLAPETTRRVFLVLVIALHSCALALARI